MRDRSGIMDFGYSCCAYCGFCGFPIIFFCFARFSRRKFITGRRRFFLVTASVWLLIWSELHWSFKYGWSWPWGDNSTKMNLTNCIADIAFLTVPIALLFINLRTWKSE